MTQDLGSMPLEKLMRHTPLAIAAADATGHLTMLSPALQRLLNQPFRRVSEDEMVAQFDLFACDGVTPLRPEDIPLSRALRGEVVIDAVVASRLDGEVMVYLRCNASPLRGEDDEIVGAVVLVQDVTAEMMAQRDQDELRERLVVTVNHELRTPLAKIIGNAELLQDDCAALPARLQHSVEAISRSAEELMNLADVVSDLSDLEERTKLTKTYGNIAGLVADAVAKFADRAASRHLELASAVPARVTATVDPGEVARAVTALLENAVTYAPPGSRVEVEVAAQRDYVDISVRDEGTGIPPEERTRLVKPFERGDHHEFQPVSSKGLGLAVAHTVATAHGGELLLDTCVPSGLCASLRLPRFAVVRRTQGDHDRVQGMRPTRSVDGDT